MKLLLMRHAEADSGDELDPTRALTPTGKAQAKMMAKWLKRQDEQPDLIIESNMLRSQQTAARIAKKIGCDVVRSGSIDPDGKPQDAIDTINDIGASAKAEIVLVVTHAPLVEGIVALMTGGARNYFHFAHAAIAHFDDAEIFHWLVTPNVVARDEDELDLVTSELEEAAELLEASIDRIAESKRPNALIALATTRLRKALQKQKNHFVKTALPKAKRSFTEGLRPEESIESHRAQLLLRESDISTALAGLKPISNILGKSSITPLLSQAAFDGGSNVMDGVGRQLVTVPDSVSSYLESRSLDKIGADVDQTTVDELRTILTDGITNGASFTDIIKQVKGAGSFSTQRASTIAVTEVGNAFSQGTLGVGKDLKSEGLDMEKSWEAEDDPCPECQENADAGWIDVDDDFPSGDDAPLAHPNCMCALLVRRASDDE